jgi:thiamine pyrophosphate-dependent acetolactate synthase large subunit-like protein
MGDHGTRKIPQLIGADKVLPALRVVSMFGDGGFTMPMGDCINSLVDGEGA